MFENSELFRRVIRAVHSGAASVQERVEAMVQALQSPNDHEITKRVADELKSMLGQIEGQPAANETVDQLGERAAEFLKKVVAHGTTAEATFEERARAYLAGLQLPHDHPRVTELVRNIADSQAAAASVAAESGPGNQTVAEPAGATEQAPENADVAHDVQLTDETHTETDAAA